LILVDRQTHMALTDAFVGYVNAPSIVTSLWMLYHPLPLKTLTDSCGRVISGAWANGRSVLELWVRIPQGNGYWSIINVVLRR
jgi:hypothetical protein